MEPVERYHDSRLPIELYRLIVSEIKDRKDILRLLTVSRAFNYEAEHVLYRKLSIDMVDYDSFRFIPLQSKSCRQRSAPHLYSLEVVLSGYSNLVVQILKSAPNLKYLSFVYYRTEKSIILPKNLPFQLLKLETNGPADSALKAFLETQRELTTLILNPSSIDLELFCPIDFLPSLENVSSTGCGISVIRGSGVQRIWFMGNIRYLEEMLGSDVSVESVRSLCIPCQFEDISSLNDIFPNLEYLEGLGFPTNLNNLNFSKFTLRKIKVTHRHLPKDDECSTLASQLFTQTTLQSIEVRGFLRGNSWTMQCGAEPTVVEERLLVDNEWMIW